MTTRSPSSAQHLALLAAFIAENDRLPVRSKSEEAPLALWLTRRLAGLRAGTLDADLTRGLNNLDLTPNADRVWRKRLADVTDFIKENGRRPHSHSTVAGAEERSLGQWVNHQFVSRSKGILPVNRIEMLDEAGLASRQRPSIPFDQRVKDLRKFAKDHDRLPRASRKSEHSLATWMISQRMQLKVGTLSAERAEILLSISGALDTFSVVSLDTRLAQLTEFCEQSGHMPRPNALNNDHLEVTLGEWVRNHGRPEIPRETEEAERRYETILQFRATYPARSDFNYTAKMERIQAALEGLGRLPSRRDNPELVQWFTDMSRCTATGETLDKRAARLFAIASQLAPAPVYNSEERLAELEAFVKLHDRMPGFAKSATNKEKALSFWVKRRIDGSRSAGGPGVRESIYALMEANGMARDARMRQADSKRSDEIIIALRKAGRHPARGDRDFEWLQRYQGMRDVGADLSESVLKALDLADTLPTFTEHKRTAWISEYNQFLRTFGRQPEALGDPAEAELSEKARKARRGYSAESKSNAETIDAIDGRYLRIAA